MITYYHNNKNYGENQHNKKSRCAPKESTINPPTSRIHSRTEKDVEHTHGNNISTLAIPKTNLNWNKNIPMEDCNKLISSYYTNYKVMTFISYNASPRSNKRHTPSGPKIFLLKNIISQITTEWYNLYNMRMWSWTTPQSTKFKGILMITAFITRQ